MKLDQNIDRLLQEKFKCRILRNSTTNSYRYPTSKSESNTSSYGV